MIETDYDNIKPTEKVKKKEPFTLVSLFSVIPKSIGFLAKEFYNLLKSIFYGIFGFFDFIVSFFVSFFTYLFWGIKNVLMFFWKYGFKFITTEIINLITSLFYGISYIFKFIFKDIPLFIYTKSSKYVNSAYEYFKNQNIAAHEKVSSGKSLSQRINDYIVNKYENLSFVKDARERKEASLIVLSVDPNGSDAEKSPQKVTYKFLARKQGEKLKTGYFAALSKLDVYSYLIDEGYTVYSIETSWAINFFHTEASSLKRKMSSKDLIFWLTQLSTYIKAGIPLADAVKILAKQDKRKKYKGVFDSIIYELTMGESFSESLKKQGNVFPPLLINMIKSAELIGDIEGTLDDMSNYYSEIEDTKRAIKSALAYPCIILVFAIGVIVFMLVYIIPKFVAIYESMNATLNPITSFTLKLSAYLKNNYSTIILVIVIVALAYAYIYKNLRAFRAFMQSFFMHLPGIGKIIIYKEMSIFARTFASLNKNNVLLTDSIDILRKITSNEIYKGIMYKTIANLLKGEKMSLSFKDHWAIPDVAYYMIVTGESTGELDTMLEKVGEYYQKQERSAVNLIKTFIEPIMIALLAVIVGLILVSVIIPMFGIYNSINVS